MAGLRRSRSVSGDTVRVTDDSPPGAAASTTRRLLLPVVLGIVGAVLLGAALVLGLQVRSDSQAQSARTAAADAAEQQAVNITSVSASDADTGVARVLSSATGNFRTAYEEQAAALKASVQDQHVLASGRVVDSGVVTSSARSAVVVVVVEATVANLAQPTPQARRYRMQLGLEHASGRWLTSSFEMLQ